jgi:hypothetical protein
MSTLQKWMTLSLIFLCAQRAFSEQDWESRGLAYEQKIRTLLAEARTNDNYKVMDQNSRLFDQMYTLDPQNYMDRDFPKYLEAHPDRILALRLDILQFLYEMRDWKYDLKNHPPFEKYSGYCRDPEKQAELERRIAESNERRKIHLRESTLQDKYESHLRFIHMVLKSKKEDAARKGKQEALKTFEELLKKQITNAALLDIIYGRPKTPPAAAAQPPQRKD